MARALAIISALLSLWATLALSQPARSQAEPVRTASAAHGDGAAELPPGTHRVSMYEQQRFTSLGSVLTVQAAPGAGAYRTGSAFGAGRYSVLPLHPIDLTGVDLQDGPVLLHQLPPLIFWVNGVVLVLFAAATIAGLARRSLATRSKLRPVAPWCMAVSSPAGVGWVLPWFPASRRLRRQSASASKPYPVSSGAV